MDSSVLPGYVICTACPHLPSPRDDDGETVDPRRAGPRYTTDPVTAWGHEGMSIETVC